MTMRERAHREAMQVPIAAVAEKLQEVLGQQITAYAVGLKDPRTIGKYGRGEVKPRGGAETRLRHLYVITQILTTRETAETVRAWMISANPLLNDRSPVELLHEEDHQPVARTAKAEAPSLPSKSTEVYRTVLDAAESFAAAA
jgi:hypothetical protein